MLLPTNATLAGDLDDGLGKGDGFSYQDTLKVSPNTKYHQAKARGKSKNPKEDDVVINSSDGDINFGSVVDSDVKGDVIIIMDDVDATIKK